MASTTRKVATGPRLTFSVLMLGLAAYALLQSLVVPALPLLQHSLHTSQSTVTWLLTAYLLSASVFTPIFGRIGDKVGKERMFVVTLGALAVGSLLAAVATSIGVLIVARVIQGVGGGVIPLVFGIVRDEMPRHRVGHFIGITAALTGVFSGLGTVLGGPIAEWLGFHWLFWIPLVMTIVAGVAAHFCIPESPVRTPGRINWLAAALLSAWLVALLLGASEGPTWGWGSARILGLFVLSLLLIAAWIRVELRSPDPLIDMRMMRIPAVWTNNLVAFLTGMGLYACLAFIPAFVQTSPSHGYGFGSSVSASGLFLAPLPAGMMGMGLLAAPLAKSLGDKAVLMIGTSLAIFAFIIMAAAHSHEWEVLVAMALLGTSFGLVFAAMSRLVVEAVPPSQTGVASGMNTNIRTIGGAIGAALMASIVTSELGDHGLPTNSGYTYGFAALVVTAVAAVVAAALVPSHPAPEGSGGPQPVGVVAAPAGSGHPQ